MRKMNTSEKGPYPVNHDNGTLNSRTVCSVQLGFVKRDIIIIICDNAIYEKWRLTLGRLGLIFAM